MEKSINANNNSGYYDPKTVEKQKKEMFQKHSKYQNQKFRSKINPKHSYKTMGQVMAWAQQKPSQIGSDILYRADKNYLKDREGKMPNRWYNDEDEENFNRIWNEPIGSNYEDMKWMNNRKQIQTESKNTIKLTESDLKKIIKEAVEDVLDQDRRWYEYKQEESRKHQALVDYLNRNGIQSAHLYEYQSGLPVVALDTDEYHNSNAHELASSFVRSRNAYISSNTYPATTYLRINEQ
jgi:hypothetical protein